MRTRAALAREIGQLTVEEIELDPPQANEVLVRMRAAGVCHSDLHTYRGELRAVPPLVLGHEGAGIVEAVGENVTRLQVGDRIMVNWIPACETCPTCLSGRYNLCERLPATTFQALLPDGTSRLKTLDGLTLKHYLSVATMSEYAVIHEASAILIPDDVPFEVAAITGCAVVTGVGAVLNTAQARAGQPAAVIGCGGIGLSAIQGCVLVGCHPIIAVDVMESKLDFARRLGATHTVNASEQDPVEALQALTGRGPEYVFDSVGAATTISQALRAARPGGTAVIIGLHAAKVDVPIPAGALVMGNRRLLGSFVGSMQPRLDLPMLVELYRAGKLRLDELISKRYALDELPQAFEDMEAGRVARGVLVFETQVT
jgi:S-(hydroxymethyl)glutathione dehydrogenase/alcohol dehydrogenase